MMYDARSDQLATWFNEAQNEIALNGLGNTRVQEYRDVRFGQFYDLPERFLGVVECPYNYDLSVTGKIRFRRGEGCCSACQRFEPLQMIYREFPKEFPRGVKEQDTSFVCELSPPLHELLPLFAASRYWQQQSAGDYEESALAVQYMQQFEMRKNAFMRLYEDGQDRATRWIV
jgi:hypothetical protein